VQKWLVVDISFYLNFLPKLTHYFKNADLQSIFACSVSAVARNEKKFN